MTQPQAYASDTEKDELRTRLAEAKELLEIKDKQIRLLMDQRDVRARVRTSAEWKAMERLVDAAREVIRHPEFDCANESFGTLLDELQEAFVAAKSELDRVRGEGK